MSRTRTSIRNVTVFQCEGAVDVGHAVLGMIQTEWIRAPVSVYRKLFPEEWFIY